MSSEEGNGLQSAVRRTLSGHSVRRVFNNSNLVAFRKCFVRTAAYSTELIALELLENTRLTVPGIVDKSRSGDTMCLTLSVIAGRQLPKSVWLGRRREFFAAQLGRKIAILQDVTRGRYREANTLAVRDRRYLEEKVREIQFPGKELLVEVMMSSGEWLDSPEEELVLVHRDLRRPNLIWDEETEELGLIDFEVAIWGSPEGDFGRLSVLEIPAGNAWNALLEGYESAGGRQLNEERLNFFALVFCVEMLAWLRERHEKSLAERQVEAEIMARIPVLIQRHKR